MKKSEVKGFLVLLNAWDNGATIQFNTNHFDIGGTDNWVDIKDTDNHAFSDLRKYRIKTEECKLDFKLNLYCYFQKQTKDKNIICGELRTIVINSNIDISKIVSSEFSEFNINEFTDQLTLKTKDTLLHFTTTYFKSYERTFRNLLDKNNKVERYEKTKEYILTDLRDNINDVIFIDINFDKTKGELISESIEKRLCQNKFWVEKRKEENPHYNPVKKK